jgi:thymidine phosphorylase
MSGLSREEPAKPAGLARARRLGIDTKYEAVVFMHTGCTVCRSEGFAGHTRVALSAKGRRIMATLFHAPMPLIADGDAGLSEAAWQRLGLEEGDYVVVSHPEPLDSMGHVRSRIFGHRLGKEEFQAIVSDVVTGRFSDIDLSAFLTACATSPLDHAEVLAFTSAMIGAGERLSWSSAIVADKHSVGGLPANRTTPIVVAIAASLGLTIPKTSSRAITSPAGTADTMEALAPVNLDIPAMRRVVEREGGCLVWGGSIRLSPADDLFIRIERALDLDSEGQMVASILSKKIAAGATCLVIDMPIGGTAKVRDRATAESLAQAIQRVARAFDVRTEVVFGDGTQPIGCGIGPALEAADVLRVLTCAPDAPADLRARAIRLAAALLELAGSVTAGAGEIVAAKALDDGRAWAKFQAICEAQGGMRDPPKSIHRQQVDAARAGRIVSVDNRRLARLAKLAGAPDDKAAGLEMLAKVGEIVEAGQPLYMLHASTRGQLAYALEYASGKASAFKIAADD